MAKTILPSQTGASGKVLTSDGANATWQAPSGSGLGDVSGPSSATSDNIAVFDGATGKLVKDSGVSISGLAAAIDQIVNGG